jgi:hypothetical protein
VVVFGIAASVSVIVLFSRGTLALGVSVFGLSTGYWVDSSMIGHGFVRRPNGAILKFDAPGAGAVPTWPNVELLSACQKTPLSSATIARADEIGEIIDCPLHLVST